MSRILTRPNVKSKKYQKKIIIEGGFWIKIKIFEGF